MRCNPGKYAAIVLGALGCLAMAVETRAQEPTGAARLDALRFVLAKNIAHCRDCLAANDYKSLAQTVDGMKYLSSLLRSKGNDADWQAAADEVGTALGDVRAAARAADQELTASALDDFARAAEALNRLHPAGMPQRDVPRGNLRELMLLLDNLRGQAKVALLTGQGKDAKRAAFVLAELGPLVSNARTGDDWEILSHDFTRASLAAATSPEEDTAKLKPLFRAMSQACDDCHDSR